MRLVLDASYAFGPLSDFGMHSFASLTATFEVHSLESGSDIRDGNVVIKHFACAIPSSIINVPSPSCRLAAKVKEYCKFNFQRNPGD
jgi:hypothetical protein